MTDPAARTALVRAAIDILGARYAADQLGLAESTVYALANGGRRCSDAQLADIRRLLIRHRQHTGDVVQAIREHEGATAMAEAAQRKVTAP